MTPFIEYLTNRTDNKTESPKSFFDFNEILHVGRGRRVMHVGMPL